VANTNGFANARQLNRHYQEHGIEFGAATVKEYEILADAFWANPKPVHVHQCVRGKGDTVRFDPTTETFSVLDTSFVVRTFFKPKPCSTIPEPARTVIRNSGRCHDETSNLQYFYQECKRW
jgi:pyocin large subunit-like protein